MKHRCEWCGDDPLYVAYHDDEWGVPVRDDTKLFEMLILEGAQAGLSWSTILRKRETYRVAFDGFDPQLVAEFDEARIQSLLADPGIVRNRQKVHAAVKNAQASLAIQAETGDLAGFLWQFVDGSPIKNAWTEMSQIPAVSPQSEAMSKELRRQGFGFVGPTICYAFMQAVGMVNDHVTSCFRYDQVSDMS